MEGSVKRNNPNSKHFDSDSMSKLDLKTILVWPQIVDKLCLVFFKHYAYFASRICQTSCNILVCKSGKKLRCVASVDHLHVPSGWICALILTLTQLLLYVASRFCYLESILGAAKIRITAESRGRRVFVKWWRLLTRGLGGPSFKCCMVQE